LEKEYNKMKDNKTKVEFGLKEFQKELKTLSKITSPTPKKKQKK
jgi:hypothetical protein